MSNGKHKDATERINPVSSSDEGRGFLDLNPARTVLVPLAAAPRDSAPFIAIIATSRRDVLTRAGR